MTNSDKKKLSPPVIGEEHGGQIKYLKKLVFKNPKKRKEGFAVKIQEREVKSCPIFINSTNERS